MFETFTQTVGEVLHAAIKQSHQTGASVCEEDLFLPWLDREGTAAAAALAATGIAQRRDSVERALADARRHGGLSQSDSEALAQLGIDLAQVVSSIELAHGEGALAPARIPKPRRLPAGRVFTPGAKRVLSRARKEALLRGDQRIGDEHLLLALAAQPGVVADVLAEHGVTYADVRNALTRSRLNQG